MIKTIVFCALGLLFLYLLIATVAFGFSTERIDHRVVSFVIAVISNIAMIFCFEVGIGAFSIVVR